MRRPWSILVAGGQVLALSACFLAGCSDKDEPRDPLLGSFTDGLSTGLIAVTTDRVYRLRGPVIEVFDVSSPVEIQKVDELGVGLLCYDEGLPTGCDGILAESLFVYAAAGNTVARTSIATGLSDWSYPGVGDGAIEALPGGFVVGGEAVSDTAGSLHFFDTSGLEPLLVASASQASSGRILDVRTVGSRVYATNASNDLLVYDLSTLSAPVQLARLNLGTRDGWLISTGGYLLDHGISISGLALFALSADARCRVNWFALNSDLTSAPRIAEFDDGTLEFCTTIEASGDYVFVALGDIVSRHRLEVFRADVVDGLVRTVEVDFNDGGPIIAIAVDADRGLVYVSQWGALNVLDLGLLTTGEPSWP